MKPFAPPFAFLCSISRAVHNRPQFLFIRSLYLGSCSVWRQRRCFWELKDAKTWHFHSKIEIQFKDCLLNHLMSLRKSLTLLYFHNPHLARKRARKPDTRGVPGKTCVPREFIVIITFVQVRTVLDGYAN